MEYRGHTVLPGTVCALATLALTGDPAPAAGVAGGRSGGGQTSSVAVVELFTSEACPSCPAADAFLDELSDQAKKTGQKIFPLAFHVDYWSPPSRRDPLSSEQFARRQRAYAESLGLKGAYTPQMIVNGRKQFVGTQRATGREAVKTALAEPAPVALKLKVGQVKPGPDQPYHIEFEARDAPRDAVINVALVERDVTVRTARGPSARRYENIVRLFRTVPLSKPGGQKLQLSPPPGSVAENCSLIAYVQSKEDGAVLGATSISLSPAPDGQARLAPRD